MTVEETPGIENLMVRVVDQAVSFLTQEVGLEVGPAKFSGFTNGCGFASALSIEGALHGDLYLRAGEATTSEIMWRFLGEDVAPDERALMLQDTVCEVLNMIIGSAIRRLDEDGFRIVLTAPYPADPRALSFPSVHRRVLATQTGPVMLAYREAR
jgi:CheY-specific phosphatase CheX